MPRESAACIRSLRYQWLPENPTEMERQTAMPKTSLRRLVAEAERAQEGLSKALMFDKWRWIGERPGARWRFRFL